MYTEKSNIPKAGTFTIVIALTIAAMIALTLMAGLPPTENLGGFGIGVVILLAVTALIGAAGWYLLLKPLPAGLTVGKPLVIGATTRSVIALFLSLSALSTGLAGVWDEIWHSAYGIPFGEDFFWRPHLLLYFSFLTMVVVGGWSWWTLMTRARGTLQQKFRANPLLGFSFLSGAFTLYAILADPIWHMFYGKDLSPWSLPHLFILLLLIVMGLLATAYHKSLMTAQTWHIGFRQFSWRNILILLVLVGGMLDFLLLFTVQWYSSATAAPEVSAVAAAGGDVAAIRAAAAASGRGVGLLYQVVAYPDWLFPAFLAFIATIFGTLGLHNTRQVGSATLVGLITFGVRWMMDTSFSSVFPGTFPLYLIIPAMLTLDIVYAISLRRTQAPPPFWVSALITTASLTLIGAVGLPALFPFISNDLGLLPARFVVGVIAAAGAIWLGQTISAMSGEAPSENQAPITAYTHRVTAWVYSGFGLFMVWFIATATPPV